jgi:hypothetical protein
MDAFIAIYWPAIVAGFLIGIIAGVVSFRPKRKY